MYTSATSHASGNVVLSLAVVIFIVSAIAAATFSTLAWQKSGQPWLVFLQRLTAAPETATTTAPLTTTPDPLAPPFLVHAELEGTHAELETKLFIPLRAYYATKPEQLLHVAIEPVAPPHTTRVTFDTEKAGETTTHSFFYDHADAAKDASFPRWEPGLLDNTE